jgi:rhamnogalacturonyl hydrolase YesR
MHAYKLLPLALFGALASGCATAEPRSAGAFSNWPDGASPADLGIRVSRNFVPRQFRYETNPEKAQLGVIYPEICAWYGALTVADLTGDTGLRKELIGKFEHLLTSDGAVHINRSAHVDYRVFGVVPFEIYLQAKDERCLALGRELADAQWSDPTADGITAEARYWIDDMYMIPALQAQAWRATGDTKYLDRAALAMVAYLDRLQQANGLFYHGPDSHFFWGRGNGWMAAGTSELLRSLPESHPNRARILKGYRTMMAALLKYQATDGMWRQLIDDPESWPETSGTGMFTFAMVTGVNEGWLDTAEYGPAARKAWLALGTYVDPEGNIREVCVGTNKGFSREYYLDRPRAVGDLHGQAAFLWVATALLRAQ